MAIEKREDPVDETAVGDKYRNDILDKKDLNEIPEVVKPKKSSFDFGKISDLEYLYDIFSSKYDDLKSLDYLQKTHKALLEQGYPQTPTLNEYLFWTTISRRLQILYNTGHKQLLLTKDENTSMTSLADIDFLEEIQKVTSHINNLQKTIDNSLATTKKVRDVVDLHKETCEKAEKFLKQHFGEYIKRNSASGEITDITDKAYWAYAQHLVQTELGVEKIPFVWSEELRFLVEKELIPLELMAFVLRTSIEGLFYVAKIRNEKMPDINREEAEDKLKRLMIEFESIRDVKDRELLES